MSMFWMMRDCIRRMTRKKPESRGVVAPKKMQTIEIGMEMQKFVEICRRQERIGKRRHEEIVAKKKILL